MTKKEISILLGTVCAVLVFAIFAQVRTITDSTATVPQGFTEDSLRDEVLTTKEYYDNLYEEVLKEEKRLESIRKIVSKNSDETEKIEAQIKETNDLLGLTDLTGKGVVVTLDDNKAVTLDTAGILDDPSKYLVHYIDVLKSINELWNAGAEAISVNGQRIVQTTAISCIGNVISINGEKVGAPFVISAIGNQEALYGALTRVQSYLKILERDGILTDIKKSNNIVIPKYSGTLSTEYLANKWGDLSEKRAIDNDNYFRPNMLYLSKHNIYTV